LHVSQLVEDGTAEAKAHLVLAVHLGSLEGSSSRQLDHQLKRSTILNLENSCNFAVRGVRDNPEPAATSDFTAAASSIVLDRSKLCR
jgi:hypothetical protein